MSIKFPGDFNPTAEAALLEDVIVVALRDMDLINPLQLDAILKAEVIVEKVRESLADAYHQGCKDTRHSVMLSIGEA